jgi:hypothetical protein
MGLWKGPLGVRIANCPDQPAIRPYTYLRAPHLTITATTALTCPLAVASLPLSRQGAGHEGEVTLPQFLLFTTAVDIRGGLVKAGVMQQDNPRGIAGVKKGYHFHALCRVHGGVVAHGFCRGR